MKTPVGVSLEFPPRTLAGARVPFKVVMTADTTVYYAVNGILDRALEVVLVRRDRPGVRFLAKIDPRAYMIPEPPLPPSTASADVRVTEERTLDLLDYGATHYGGANYSVFAAFAGSCSDVRPLAVEDRSHSLPYREPAPAPPIPDPAEPPIPEPPKLRGFSASVVRRAGEFRVEGALREAVRPPPFASDPPLVPFVSIVAVHVRPMGGAFGGSFLVDAKEDGRDHVARFSIPIGRFAPPVSGPCRVFVFSRDSGPVVRDFIWRREA